ncbi:MAG: PQQ-dependent sugar dehydrogenase [Bacteroidales bacterium]|nr:PQQ-dependent sugar dehydrogenase [Bacteroidales bacterium]MCF8343452.1 PQQ-dependent sugar dehydrogenase [Bacteroidales bacterium]MCF8375658.1 PQQ-dependent sugar dehydrogenase [Bacteroidales bacterium]MCF8400759.1 PQQ-dependent sugar dehydrogenase [Bacteroidales bacterium]
MKTKITSIIILLFTFLQTQAQPNINLIEFATGLNNPLSIAHAGDSRLFVVEQEGYIQIVDSNGQINSSPFLDITDRVTSGGEQGLLGLAFHPDYSSNGYFYVNYTDNSGNTSISRFSVSGSNPDSALPLSEMQLLSVEQPFTNHNGGNLLFGPDSYLYIGLGDGGSGGDPQNNAQDLSVYLGKMLRIDVDGGNPYGIPADNPFVDEPEALDEIWAWGLRNPWRFSFDAETGDLWTADVGQNAYEEVNFQPAASDGGENYGWRCYEGTHEYNTSGCGPASDYTFPAFEYAHDTSGGCSVTGGVVYRGSNYPGMAGHYFFSDYCNDKLWSLTGSEGDWEVHYHGQFGGNSFSAFGEDVNGEIYIAGIQSGIIYRIVDESGMGVPGSSIDNIPYIFPNPARDHIWIDYKVAMENVHIQLRNIKGQMIYRSKLAEAGKKISLEQLGAGIYLVQLKTQDKVFSQKLMIY